MNTSLVKVTVKYPNEEINMNGSLGYEVETSEWTHDDNLQTQALQALSTCRSNITLLSSNK
jgi:hypothetical protein